MHAVGRRLSDDAAAAAVALGSHSRRHCWLVCVAGAIGAMCSPVRSLARSCVRLSDHIKAARVSVRLCQPLCGGRLAAAHRADTPTDERPSRCALVAAAAAVCLSVYATCCIDAAAAIFIRRALWLLSLLISMHSLSILDYTSTSLIATYRN